MVLYSDILSREKIEAGKAILDKLIEEGWEVQTAAWIVDADTTVKRWQLCFSLRLEDSESRQQASHRVWELEKACLADLYDVPLYDDTFGASITFQDSLLTKAVFSKYPVHHPIGQRESFHFMDSSWEFFIYNLNHTPVHENARGDEPVA